MDAFSFTLPNDDGEQECHLFTSKNTNLFEIDCMTCKHLKDMMCINEQITIGQKGRCVCGHYKYWETKQKGE